MHSMLIDRNETVSDRKAQSLIDAEPVVAREYGSRSRLAAVSSVDRRNKERAMTPLKLCCLTGSASSCPSACASTPSTCPSH
jgi:hypothetical protein